MEMTMLACAGAVIAAIAAAAPEIIATRWYMIDMSADARQIRELNSGAAAGLSQAARARRRGG
jgi:hypothetical protein